MEENKRLTQEEKLIRKIHNFLKDENVKLQKYQSVIKCTVVYVEDNILTIKLLTSQGEITPQVLIQREIWRKKKQIQRDNNSENVNKKNREYYQKNKEKIKKQIALRKIKYKNRIK